MDLKGTINWVGGGGGGVTDCQINEQDLYFFAILQQKFQI